MQAPQHLYGSTELRTLSKQMKNEFPAYVYAWHMLNASLDLTAHASATVCECL